MGWIGLPCVLAALLVGGCGSSGGPGLCPSGTCHGERTVSWQFQRTSAPDLDVLFIIDDSPASAALPAAVRDGYPQMAQVIQDLTPPDLAVAPGSAPPSLHVAFVSADFGYGGACTPASTRSAACGVSTPDQFLSTAACGQQPNFAGSLGDAFACLADFGHGGCSSAQPFAAIRRVLGGDSPGGGLAGRSLFLRDSAALQVVIVAAQDDASAPPSEVASLVALLKGSKPDPAQVFVSVIGPSTTCATDPPLATAAPSLAALVEGFGSHGLYYPNCGASPVQALMLLATRLAIDIAPPCLAGVRDVHPELAGVQPTCAVEQQVTQLDGSIARAALPSCDAGPAPCWRLRDEPTLCSAGLLLDIDQGAGWCPALSTITSVSCVGCLDPSDPACARRQPSP